jgi:hypothetical protein
MIHVGLHSVEIYHKSLVGKRKKEKIYFAECPELTLGSLLCRVPAGGHSAKTSLCRVLMLGARQTLTAVSYRRPLTVLCRAPPSPSVWHSAKRSLPNVYISVPRVLLLVNVFITESWTLPNMALDKVFFVEYPTKNIRQSDEHSVKPRIPVAKKEGTNTKPPTLCNG